MLRHSRIITLFCIATLFLYACNSVPDHRRYIPKDAALVAGVDLKSLGKTIAWNMITGSKLFKEMEKRVPQKNGSDIMSGLDKAGIDALNTFYVYLKTDKRFNGGIKVTALVPLSNSGDWENYVKKGFPASEIKQHNGIKTTSLGKDMYVGWNNNLLIIVNSAGGYGDASEGPQPTGPAVDMAVELDAAFGVTKDNSIIGDKNFTKLENSGHDLTLWINYEQIMSQYMNENEAPKMAGVSLSPTVWKGTAFACGFDFKKGKITGDMAYYSSGEMSSVYKELGATNASQDMIDRLPSNGLDMMIAMHLSPKGIKGLLEKTEMLGLANAGLSSIDGMDIDKLLDAFTGDMAFTMNGLSVEQAKGGAREYGMPEKKANAAVCYVMKINKKENFQKVIDIALQTGALKPTANGYVIPMSTTDSVFIMMNGEYAALSNKYNEAKAILDGTNKSKKLPAAVASQVSGHPFALYLDIQQAISKVDMGGTISGGDSIMYLESKKLLTDLYLSGGEFKDDAMATHLEVNFTNKDESSIIALLDFGMKISDAQEKAKQQMMQQMMQDTLAPQPN